MSLSHHVSTLLYLFHHHQHDHCFHLRITFFFNHPACNILMMVNHTTSKLSLLEGIMLLAGIPRYHLWQLLSTCVFASITTASPCSLILLDKGPSGQQA